MKFVSWNVAGYRACLKKGFSDFFEKVQADFFCLQEVKATEEEIDLRDIIVTEIWQRKRDIQELLFMQKKNPFPYFMAWVFQFMIKKEE